MSDEELNNTDFSEIVEERDELPSIFCPLCQLRKFKGNDLLAYLYKKSGVTEDDIANEIKSRFRKPLKEDSRVKR